ncbi:MAG: arylesterase [Cocleimonas sp.]
MYFGLLFLISTTSTTFATEKDVQKILVWGDSLSAAYGIPVEKGWVSLLETKLGDGYEIINGSISGETTQGGLSRLSTALTTHIPDLIIIELGANDGLRGFPPQVTKHNLRQMIEQSKQANTKVMLMGMKIPPNYGVAYSDRFESLFKDLATEYKLPFIPFFLKDVIEDLTFFQKDELHPTAEAQPIILETIFLTLQDALQNNFKNTSGGTLQDSATDTKEPEAIKNPA